MALWKPFKGNRAGLDAVEKHDGYVYFCIDDGSLFFDYVDSDGNLQRKQINAKDAETLMGMSLEEILSFGKSDWNQNDESAPDYIKGRTHWMETAVIEFYSNDALTVSEDYVTITLSHPLAEGEEYTITVNDVEYNLTARHYDYWGCSIIGGAAYLDTSDGIDDDVPFAIDFYPGGEVNFNATNGTYSVSIRGRVDTYHKIDEKFIPGKSILPINEDRAMTIDNLMELSSGLYYLCDSIEVANTIDGYPYYINKGIIDWNNITLELSEFAGGSHLILNTEGEIVSITSLDQFGIHEMSNWFHGFYGNQALAGQIPVLKEDSDTGNKYVEWGDQIQSDWSVNDETSPAYVKNRPFYHSENAVLYDSTITTSDMGGIYAYMDQSDGAKATSSLIEGETYTVTFDNNIYTCICSNGTHIGDLSLVGAGDATNEPFVIFVYTGTCVGIATKDVNSATHTVKIEGSVIKTIDVKYLPELPYITLQEGNQQWVTKSNFAQTNSNLTYRGKTYSTNHEYFMHFLTVEGIWQISLVVYNSAQIPASSSFRMNYASSDGTLSFYWSNTSNTTEITTVMHAYLYDVNTGSIIRRETNVQSVTIGAYTKKSHNFDFYIDKSNPQDAEIVRNFDDYIDVNAEIAALNEYVDTKTQLENLGVYIGPDEPTDTNIKIWINTAEEGTGVTPLLPRIATITLTADAWEGSSNPWSQVVTVNGVGINSKIDLQPTPAQIIALQNADIALMAENNNGVVTIYALGGKPTTDMTMQVLITEVVYV